MNGEGTITATDKNASRLERLRERAVSLALSCVTAVPLDPLADAIPNDFMPFDAILVDAPCTGWGTFRRRPDLRWRLKTDDSRRSGKKALQLIERIYPSLKPGGVLIYSTCTLSPDENRQVVEEFLKNHNDCIIEPAQDFLPPQFAEAIDGRGFLDLFPARWGLDGAFAARLKKRG